MPKLKEIATVSTGVTFRSRVEASPLGNTRVIQMKDLGRDNLVRLYEAILIELASLKQHQLVKIGDIIFRSRGQDNTAAILQEKSGNAVVAAPLFRVRLSTQKVIPEFLLWWINQPSSQSYFNSRAKGTLSKMISKQCLENLDVHLPSLERQREIASIFCLSIQEQYLLEEIKKFRMRYTQGILMRMASESRHTASSTIPQTHARQL